MKKRNGFTLVELIVGMAIMAIIFGGIVYIFGASTKAMQAGQNQQQAYEDARVTMDILKTSLRYAVLDNTTYLITPEKPNKTTTSFSFYTKQFDLHWNINNGETKIYKVVVDFKTGTNPNSTTSWSSGKKQLVITITDEDGKQVSKSPFKYPQYEANSGWASDADFPVIYGEENSTEGAYKTGITLFNIHLPFVYKIAGSDKTETLDSRVQPVAEDHYDKTMSDGSGSVTPTTTKGKATTLVEAAAAMYAKDNTTLNNSYSGYYNIVSGATKESSVITALNNLNSFMKSTGANGYTGTLANLETHSWILVPTLSGSTVTKWTLYVAKNVIDDVDNINGTYTVQSKLDEEMKRQATVLGKLIIRGNTGFLCYMYTSSGANAATGVLDTNDDGTIKEDLGYVTGYRPGSSSDKKTTRAINPEEWLPITYKDSNGNILSNFKNVSSSNNKNPYIECLYSGSKISRNGKYQRIDYDYISGAEYTPETCAAAGTTYTYPYGIPTANI